MIFNSEQRQFSSETTFKERLESLKAGTLSAMVFALVFGLITWGNNILTSYFAKLLPVELLTGDFGLSVINALLSGFLFGVTYRYIMRQDENPHLKSGAVLAFGLVRGMTQIDVGWNTQGILWPYVILAVESVVLFMLTQTVLEGAIAQQWIKRFNAE